MLTAREHKNFTASCDSEAETLLEKVLAEIGNTLSGTKLCVVLGGSYGRGDGGVRKDRENGILYNDLDFFVFARQKCDKEAKLLDEIAEKYEKELKVDVDFSRIMSVKEIKSNAKRLMMQELKRGYYAVCGEDLLAEYLYEIPAEKLPFSEACRLLLNRGMGLLLAGEKINNNSEDTDFILRNINKAILGACDAALIVEKNYKWTLAERSEAVNKSNLSDDCKKLYAQAVEFKKNPSRAVETDLQVRHSRVQKIFIECMELVCGKNCSELYLHCKNSDEISLKNFIKYCIKSRQLVMKNFQLCTLPAVAVLLPDLYFYLKNAEQGRSIMQSKLYQQWLIFN